MESANSRQNQEMGLEARTGVEPVMEVLQTSQVPGLSPVKSTQRHQETASRPDAGQQRKNATAEKPVCDYSHPRFNAQRHKHVLPRDGVNMCMACGRAWETGSGSFEEVPGV